MSLRSWLPALALCVYASASAQSTPSNFRLVLPKGPGSILIDTAGGWKLDRVVLYEHGTRPVVQLHNDSLGLTVSYLLEHYPPYYTTPEDCENDTLSSILQGPLARAVIKNKKSESRTIKSGQTMAVGSYLIAKSSTTPLDDENVFGFLTHDNTCATIHISRSGFKPGDEGLFGPLLDAFTYDPTYTPTSQDYAIIARLLPPDMASAYGPTPKNSTGTGSQDPWARMNDQSLDFALADHNGLLHMDAPNFKITELSAKPNGKEFGIRATSSLTLTEELGFLFLPSPAQPTATSCRDWMMKSEEKAAGYRKVLGLREAKSNSGVPVAIVDYEQSRKPAPFQFVRRFFVASGDLCADISIYAMNSTMAEADKSLIDSLRFDPDHKPDFFDRFRYATVLFQNHAVAAAAPVYESSLTLVNDVPDAQKWRRVATDQASMAYGMAGDLAKSRALNQAAIAKDPDYPLYYYDLACADAESGDAAAARIHLQQAFDRRHNVLPGEKFPDPTQDDSILKLKNNAAFWAFVQSLPRT